MKRLFSIRFLLSILVLTVTITSCSENKKPKRPDEKQHSEQDNIEVSKKLLYVFFELLNKEDFETCYTHFSDSLKQNVGKETFIKTIKERNTEFPNSDSLGIYYTQVLSTGLGNVYTFYYRVFSKSELIFYENLSICFHKDLPKILGYNYSKNIFYTPKMANDTDSDLKIFLENTYQILNSGDLEKAYALIDETVKEKMDYSKLEAGFKEIILKYKSNYSFSVKSIWTEILYGVPVLNIIVDASNFGGDRFLDKIIISDRNGKFFVAYLEREDFEKTELVKIERLPDSELTRYAEIASKFYEFLKTSNFYDIMQMLDISVFVNNDYEVIKSSFSAREQYYGKPKNLKNTLVKTYSLGSKTLVEFNFDVENTSGKISYEKIFISKTTEDKYFIFSYDFRENRF
ncbi:MAG TPA: hypothetical protein PLG05_06080 [Bacteroidales bacterium]|nr:hypothetical protein [Bacteroidales bacterium]HOR60526.1 hypothetical protein [Bacteroidales bacterium]HPL04726.1 hypothetical protein [Bacteroidales bacterium]